MQIILLPCFSKNYDCNLFPVPDSFSYKFKTWTFFRNPSPCIYSTIFPDMLDSFFFDIFGQNLLLRFLFLLLSLHVQLICSTQLWRRKKQGMEALILTSSNSFSDAQKYFVLSILELLCFLSPNELVTLPFKWHLIFFLYWSF